MPIPSTSYLKIVGGVTSTISTIFTSNLIKVGDLIKVTGTAQNNGIFLVAQVVDNLNSGSALGSQITAETQDSDITSGTTIVMDTAIPNLTAGMSVTGTGVKAGSFIASVTQTSDPATFELSDSVVTTVPAGETFTFKDRDVYYVLKGTGITNESSAGSTDPTIRVIRSTGDKMCALGQRGTSTNAAGVDIWSNNATTDYTSTNNGWSNQKINPTLAGTNGAKYIYHFVDEVLRVCDTETTNTSIIKWFGYIQRNQFNHNLGLTFAEWQEHSSVLRSPETNSANLTIAFGHTTHATDTAGAYFNESSNKSRGVARKLRNASDTALLLDGAVTTSTSFVFDDGTNDVLDQNFAGELITINTDYDVRPTEILFCTKPAAGLAPNVQYERNYGGIGSDTYSNNETPILRRGVGFNIGVSNGTADGDWEGLTYEFYQSFLYDGNQESVPVRMGDGAASISAFTHSQTAGKSMRVSVYADVAYTGRISGGRIYIREANTDNELALLVDIDIVKGVRTTIDGDHVAWTENASAVDKGFCVIADATGNASKPNLDTYTTINGFAPDVKYVSLGGAGESYQASVVENRRTFIANVRVIGSSGELETFGDRIMYSEINKFDTILPHNFIDVSKGDYGVYTALESYADRLVAFKHNLVHIINIASPSPANWYLEETIKYSGVNKIFSVTKTKYGIAWVAEDGCYIYDGQRVTNLIKDKIAVSKASFLGTGADKTWNAWYRGTANVKDPMIGYDSISNSLVIMRSPNDSSDNSDEGWIYDFDSDGWVFHDLIFTDSHLFSNFSTDWNNNLIVATNSSASDTTSDFKKFLPISLGNAHQVFITKDIDFGEPGIIKKVYKVIVTYKSNGSVTTPFKYAIDGKQNFSGGGGGTFTGNLADTSGAWDVVTLTPASTVQCQSIQIQFAATTSGVYEFNDISIEYRYIRNKNVT
jgi:hypothetical protein